MPEYYNYYLPEDKLRAIVLLIETLSKVGIDREDMCNLDLYWDGIYEGIYFRNFSYMDDIVDYDVELDKKSNLHQSHQSSLIQDTSEQRCRCRSPSFSEVGFS